jgi:hypothetical protein
MAETLMMWCNYEREMGEIPTFLSHRDPREQGFCCEDVSDIQDHPDE